jgi:hypothetical protein
VTNKSPKYAELLIFLLNLQDIRGLTVVHIAAWRGREEILDRIFRIVEELKMDEKLDAIIAYNNEKDDP